MFGVNPADLESILPVLIVVILLLGAAYALVVLLRDSSGQ